MHSFLQIPQGEVPIYVAESFVDSNVSVLVLPAIFGIDQDVEELCDEIAGLGANAIAVDPFWEVDPGPLSHSFEDVRRALDRKNKVGTQRGIDLALEYCKTLRSPPEKLIALGICYGGHLAFIAAAKGLVDGAVILHGGGLTDYVRFISDIQVPLSIHFGDQDSLIPMDDVLLLQEGFAEVPHVDIQVYEGARHGFSHQSSLSFHQEAYMGSLNGLDSMIGHLSEEQGV